MQLCNDLPCLLGEKFGLESGVCESLEGQGSEGASIDDELVLNQARARDCDGHATPSERGKLPFLRRVDLIKKQMHAPVSFRYVVARESVSPLQEEFGTTAEIASRSQ